jgi:Zn finger protein HypA/HybF involved in hydrogenase expression
MFLKIKRGVELLMVIDFHQKKEEKEKNPHLEGKARCLDCKHEWEAVAPAGTEWLECPECHSIKGRFVYHFEPETFTKWVCNCGNDLFYATPDGYFCPNCGEWQTGF